MGSQELYNFSIWKNFLYENFVGMKILFSDRLIRLLCNTKINKFFMRKNFLQPQTKREHKKCLPKHVIKKTKGSWSFKKTQKRKSDCITRIKGKENQKVSKDLKFRWIIFKVFFLKNISCVSNSVHYQTLRHKSFFFHRKQFSFQLIFNYFC